MPCNSDYLNPNLSEQESKRAAQNIVYVHECLAISCPDWIKKAANATYGNSEKLNDLVVILCEICTNLTREQKEAIMYNGRSKKARQLADWWEEHQEADRKRLMKESRRKLLGYQIVSSDGELLLPEGFHSFEIITSWKLLKEFFEDEDTNPKDWHVVPVYEGDIEEPSFI